MASCPIKAMEALHQALDDAHQVAVSCIGPQDTLHWLTQIHSANAKLDALACISLASSTEPFTPACETTPRSVAAVVAADTNANPRRIRADQNLGTWLSDYPVFAEAFRRGRISKDHLRAIRARENRRTRPHLDDAQEYLVEAAGSCDWQEFRATLRYWELAADPDGEEPKEQVANRSCNYSKRADGTVTGRFTLDPLSGNAFATALEQQIQRLFRRDTETDESRTATQRRADALVDLVTRGAKRTDGTMPAPLVHIVMSERVASDGFARLVDDTDDTDDGAPADGAPADGAPADGAPADGAPADGRADPERLPIDPNDIDRRCELIDGTPIHPRFALAVLAAAHLRRLVLGSDSEVLDLGREVRGFPKVLKQILLIVARGRCQARGCDAPHAWLQADHLMPWSRGGKTAIGNGQILCDPHNKKKRDEPPPQRE